MSGVEKVTVQHAKDRKAGRLKDRVTFATFEPKDLVPKLPPEYTGMVTVGSIQRIVHLEEELRLRNRTPPEYDWTPPEGVDRRVHLRSLFPTVEVNGKQYLDGGRLGVVQALAADVATMAAASSSAGEDEGVCTIM